jgi:phosphate transport system permease protein
VTPPASQRLRRAHRLDRLIAAAITAGGSLILLAVAFLMIFLVAECLPLMRRGSSEPQAVQAGPAGALAAAEDEYRENVLVLAQDGAFHVIGKDGASSRLVLDGAAPPLRQAVAGAGGRLFALADAESRLQVWSLRIQVRWQGQRRVLVPQLRLRLAAALPARARILAVAGDADTVRVVLADGGHGVLLSGDGDNVKVTTLACVVPPVAGAIAGDGGAVWLATPHQLLWYVTGELGPASSLAAAAESPLPATATAVTLVLGDQTCLVGDESGTVAGWQVVAGEVAGSRRLDQSASFPGRGRVLSIAASERDKTFAILRTTGAEVAYLTTRQVLATLAEASPRLLGLAFSPRRDGMFAVTPNGEIHRWTLAAPHPEVSFRTLFLPVRYEGYTKADLVWQSTGGASDFEPKLSLVPLIVGTFKGALYALLFAGPCAVAAALYVSQFAPPRVRLLTKPVVELMSALPSVVVGFLAALFLAPLLQRHMVGALALFVLLPLTVAGGGAAWGAAPLPFRRRLGRGGELAAIVVLMAGTVTAAFALEDPLRLHLFGGDLGRWLTDTAGVGFDQRNAIVVGFALGFAVIPIIFTLAEDAFSNVPPSLVSASLALGATRWQAAYTVVLPAASPGLFAAVMTGLGRAVGETMIVLMATGNTPILSLSPFNGMRTMSACIAVELPEAPYGGSLYRVLILTALLLFGMTFALNTVAVMISTRLRARFGKLAA